MAVGGLKTKRRVRDHRNCQMSQCNMIIMCCGNLNLYSISNYISELCSVEGPGLKTCKIKLLSYYYGDTSFKCYKSLMITFLKNSNMPFFK